MGDIEIKLTVLNQTIKLLCEEIKELRSYSNHWTQLSEEVLFYEAAVCIISSQMLYEMAVAIADRLKHYGLLQKSASLKDYQQYARQLKSAFSKPIKFSANNVIRKTSPRFRNRLPSFLSSTALNIYGNGYSIKTILRSADSAAHARQLLIRSITGFGPKQASLFLRRIGFCSELAVLDIHILDYLKLSNGLHLNPNRLSQIKVYEDVEAEFKRISENFGHSMGCVDLATWITMRVAKREYST